MIMPNSFRLYTDQIITIGGRKIQFSEKLRLTNNHHQCICRFVISYSMVFISTPFTHPLLPFYFFEYICLNKRAYIFQESNL